MRTMESRRPARIGAQRQRRRRRLARVGAALGVLGVLGVVAAGCADPEPTQTGSGDPSVASSAEFVNVVRPVSGPPRMGGTLRVGLDAESEGFDPTDSRFAPAALTIGRAVFDPLVVIGADLRPQPYLAESLTPSADSKQWDIRLRPNIKFHNGEDLNSAAVKKDIEKFRASPRVGTAAKPIQAVDAVDPLTVRLTMDQPWATFPLFLAVQPGLVAAPAMLDSPEGSRNPIGTGPFTFKSWETDKSLRVEKNADYWRKGVTYLDAIDFRPMANDQTRYQSLQTGDIDVMISPREQTIQDLAKDGKAGTFQVVRASGDNDVNMIMFNTEKGPLSDTRLRQAVAYATDRTQLLALTNSPPEVAADSVYAKSSPWYHDGGYPKYDPARAKELVAQIQAEKGPIKLLLNAVSDTDVRKQVQVLQSLLQAVGIQVDIEETEQASLINKAISGDYQLMTWRQFGAVDPDANYIWWHSDYASGGVALNMARNKDPQIDAALTAGRSSNDLATRKKAYDTVQERQAIDLPYLWTTHLRWTMGASNNVHNIEGGTLPDGSRAAGLFNGVMPLNEFWIES
jgi:ABC-type transport system substrate-binding protein